MVTKDLFRQAWGKFATGITILTTMEPGGHVHGMTANGVASVSLEPFLILACIGHDRNTYPLVKNRKRFAISILAEEQRDLAEYYVRDPKERTGDAPANFRFTPAGSAIVEKCLAYMDCRVVSAHEAGDHTIFVAEVEEIGLDEGRPLVFFNGAYASLEN